MQLVIADVLTVDDLATVGAALGRARFVDGRDTAGFAARTVKNNQQTAGSDRSLAISGEIRQGFAFPWSGVMFFPGLRPMTPANLSAFEGIAFQAKGDGGTYQLMVFATKLGRIPAVKTFATGADWQRHIFSFADFGLDGSDVTGFVFSGGPAQGAFSFQIDEVGLVPKNPQP